nr:RES domain-containing protein [Psychroserpens burtonensis]
MPSESYFKEQFNGHYYRVRPLNDINNRQNFSEYTYPPKQFVQNQRANIKNSPVFYSSIHPKTAVLEYVLNQKDEKENDLLALSVWNITCDRDIRVVNLLNEKNTKEGTKFLGINNTNSFKKYAESKFSAQDAQYMISLHEYFINSFCNKNSHIFSSYISYKCLYENPNFQVDILLYPSLVQNNSSINIALNTNFADKYLNLKRVYVVNTIRNEIERPTFYGDVMFFKNNLFEKEMILDNSTAMATLTHLDFRDSVK